MYYREVFTKSLNLKKGLERVQFKKTSPDFFFISKICYEGQNNGSFYCSTFLDFAPKGLRIAIFVLF